MARFWIAVGAAAFVVVVTVALLRAPEGDPSAEEVRDAAERLFGHKCRSDISVHGIDHIGGPGLPEGMRAAREIVCDADVAAAQPEDESGHPRIAVQFVFASDQAARDWMDGDDYQGGDWWLRDGTLIAAGGPLSHREWLRLRQALSLR